MQNRAKLCLLPVGGKPYLTVGARNSSARFKALWRESSLARGGTPHFYFDTTSGGSYELDRCEPYNDGTTPTMHLQKCHDLPDGADAGFTACRPSGSRMALSQLSSFPDRPGEMESGLV